MGTCSWAHPEDDAVIDVIAQALEKRSPQSRRRGRLETPADVVIRMLILKGLFDWSYDDRNTTSGPTWSTRVYAHRCR
jgi:hypothetical protein